MTSEQIKALIQMLVTLIVTVASIFGYDLAETQAQQAAIVMAAIAVVAYSVWRNCNITSKAGQSQQILDGLKEGTIDPEVVDVFLDMCENGVFQDGKGESEDDGQ